MTSLILYIKEVTFAEKCLRILDPFQEHLNGDQGQDQPHQSFTGDKAAPSQKFFPEGGAEQDQRGCCPSDDNCSNSEHHIGFDADRNRALQLQVLQVLRQAELQGER